MYTVCNGKNGMKLVAKKNGMKLFGFCLKWHEHVGRTIELVGQTIVLSVDCNIFLKKHALLLFFFVPNSQSNEYKM